MHKIYSAEDLAAAHLLQGLLHGAGIPCHIFNQYAQGGLGEIPFVHAYPEIWLEQAADIPTACAIISRFEQAPDPQAELACPACGEASPATFDLCWQCGAELSQPGDH